MAEEYNHRRWPLKAVDTVTLSLSVSALIVSVISLVHTMRNDRLTDSLNRPVLAIDKGFVHSIKFGATKVDKGGLIENVHEIKVGFPVKNLGKKIATIKSVSLATHLVPEGDQNCNIVRTQVQPLSYPDAYPDVTKNLMVDLFIPSSCALPTSLHYAAEVTITYQDGIENKPAPQEPLFTSFDVVIPH